MDCVFAKLSRHPTRPAKSTNLSAAQNDLECFLVNIDRENNAKLRQSLIQLSAGLGTISDSLSESARLKCEGIVSQLERSIIPQLEADCPLLIAVTGGGSTGKSTIFNALAAKKASAAGPRAGFTRRMVAAIHPKVAADERKMALLFERFRANARPRKLEAPDEAFQNGDPVYVECPNVPEHLVLIDTPDFDTGTREGFTNRESAKEILDVADAILYIATNATYNNKANSDFVREILSEVGLRKVALLYRFAPVFDDEIVKEHMSVLLSNLYPDERTAKESCIGVWRIDESNDVAAGVCEPVIRPLAGGARLLDALAALDPTKTRANVMRTTIEDALRCAESWVGECKTAAWKFEAYRDALRFQTSAVCRECLAMSPQRDILRVFAEEWSNAQPWAVRNGHWLSRTVIRVFKKKVPDKGNESDFRTKFRKTFLKNAGFLQNSREPPGCHIKFPRTDSDMQPLVGILVELARKDPNSYSIVEDLREIGEKKTRMEVYSAKVARPQLPVTANSKELSPGEVLSRMADEATEVMGETESIRPEIRELVRSIREGMSFWKSAKEWLSASLDTVAVVGSLTYVAATGDAFTGGALLSMFGLNDLVAVPALGAFLAANGNIDRKAAERQIAALFTTWAQGKAGDIRVILEGGITGADIAACDNQCKRLNESLEKLGGALQSARTYSDKVFRALNA